MAARNLVKHAQNSRKKGETSRLSDEDKWTIVHRVRDGDDITDVAATIGCTRATVYKWLHRYKSQGNVSPAPKSGRKRLLDETTEDMVMELMTNDDSNTADQIGKHLHAKGVLPHLVSRPTLIRGAQRAARRAGEKLWVQRGPPPKAMTAATKAKRLAFALANKNTDWSRVLFTDRKKFHFRYPGSKVKRVRWHLGPARNSRTAVNQPNHPDCVNIYAGISKFGVTSAHVVAGSTRHTSQHTNKQGAPARNITSSEYREVLSDTLLPEGKRLFSVQGTSSWTLQQDNDPTHKVALDVVKQWNADKRSNVQVLPCWPPNSPDLNLIENVWAWVAREVDQLGCSSFEEFKEAVCNKLAAIPKEHLSNLYASMKNRLEQVIANEGGPSGY